VTTKREEGTHGEMLALERSSDFIVNGVDVHL
jgi:hypothetical protein